jgi:hypothetical protein
MKAKERSSKTKSSGKRAVKDLRARKDQGVKGGRSDLAAKLQQQLNEANSIYN